MKNTYEIRINDYCNSEYNVAAATADEIRILLQNDVGVSYLAADHKRLYADLYDAVERDKDQSIDFDNLRCNRIGKSEWCELYTA